MIKFFRKIRQKLIDQGNLRKYLVYAIGEIVLVVIGILIALQINNWNENRKLRVEEIKLLQNFKTSIDADTARVNRYIRTFSGIDKAITSILLHLEKDLPYHDSLNYRFNISTGIWWPRLDQEVFATLTSNDLNNITNDSLQEEITSYYSFAKREFDVSIVRYANIIEDASKNVFNSRFNALWGKTWDDPDVEKLGIKSMLPNDFEALKNDKEYLYFLRSQKNQLFWYVRDPLNKAKKRADYLLESLNKELKQVDKK